MWVPGVFELLDPLAVEEFSDLVGGHNLKPGIEADKRSPRPNELARMEEY